MLYDCHCHTHHSHDSQANPREICLQALQAGLQGVAFTDHCDLEYVRDTDIFTPILHSVADATALAAEFANRLLVMRGVEVCELLYEPQAAQKAMDLAEYDVFLGSLHAVRYKGFTQPFSKIDFTDFKSDLIYDYWAAYFDDALEMAQTFDFDVLCHITVPLRYIVGKYGHAVDMQTFAPKIDEILRALIERGIALECNTASLAPNTLHYCPDLDIFARYYALGGRKITLGSDAHTPKRVGEHFAWAAEKLQKIGFKQAVYFKNREAIYYDL